MTFDTLDLSPELLRATTDLGFSEPMPVQQEVIPYLSSHRGDLIALSKTGSGKTAAYGLPLLERIIQAKGSAPCGLILTPTRELAMQVQSDLVALAKYTSVRQILALYGGASIEEQIRQLAKGYHIIVATPGRLCDLIRRKAVKLRKVSVVVLDEADVMLDMGFQRDLQEILQAVPQQVEHWLFSATMSREVREIADNYISDAHEVQIGALNKANADIKHLYVAVPARHKYAALKRVVDYYPNIYGIIFCRTRAETKEIAEWLIRDGYNADALHGDLSQAQRDMVMNRFRIRNLQLLVATDVAARGLDVDDVTHVLHYGLPADPDSYTHRSGRTARAGKTGLSIAICHLRDSKQIRIIEQHAGIRIESMPLPSGQEICKKQLFALATRIEYADSNEHGTQYDELLNAIVQKLAWLPPEEIIRRVLTLEADRIMRYYANTPDLSAQELATEEPKYRTKGSPAEHRKASQKRSRTNLPPMTSLRINLGKRDKLYPNRLLELINRTLPYKITIGKINLSPSYSYFEVASEWAETVAAALSEEEYNGRPIRVTIQKDR